MYGLEHDESKENEIDCVWAGNTTNHASKYSDLASGGEIFISESVYNNLSDSYKQVWTEAAKYKGSQAFLGYITSNYYLDYAEELGTPTNVATAQVYNNLNEYHKGLLNSYTDNNVTRYEGDIVRTAMEEWYKENCT